MARRSLCHFHDLRARRSVPNRLEILRAFRTLARTASRVQCVQRSCAIETGRRARRLPRSSCAYEVIFPRFFRKTNEEMFRYFYVIQLISRVVLSYRGLIRGNALTDNVLLSSFIYILPHPRFTFAAVGNLNFISRLMRWNNFHGVCMYINVLNSDRFRMRTKLYVRYPHSCKNNNTDRVIAKLVALSGEQLNILPVINICRIFATRF